MKFETTFGANCLGSRKVPLKSHKEPQTKVSRWKAPKRVSNQRASRRAIDVRERTTYDDDDSDGDSSFVGFPTKCLRAILVSARIPQCRLSMQSGNLRIREKCGFSTKADASLSCPAGSTVNMYVSPVDYIVIYTARIFVI